MRNMVLAIAAAALIIGAISFALVELRILKGNTTFWRRFSSGLLAVGLLAIGFALASGP